jgi:hypothetical protein
MGIPQTRLRRNRILPVDVGPDFEQLWMDPVKIRPVEVRRILEHVDPVRHEADPSVGIPVEAEGEIRLPAALDVVAAASGLGEKDTAVVQVDFADPRGKLTCAGATIPPVD